MNPRAKELAKVAQDLTDDAFSGAFMPSDTCRDILDALTRAEQEGEARERERLKDTSSRLFVRIKHGDEKHQAWLKDELDKFFSEEP